MQKYKCQIKPRKEKRKRKKVEVKRMVQTKKKKAKGKAKYHIAARSAASRVMVPPVEKKEADHIIKMLKQRYPLMKFEKVKVK